MSVLLNALKKASAEKKKKANVSLDEVMSASADFSSNQPEEVALDFNFTPSLDSVPVVMPAELDDILEVEPKPQIETVDLQVIQPANNAILGDDSANLLNMVSLGSNKGELPKNTKPEEGDGVAEISLSLTDSPSFSVEGEAEEALQKNIVNESNLQVSDDFVLKTTATTVNSDQVKPTDEIKPISSLPKMEVPKISEEIEEIEEIEKFNPDERVTNEKNMAEPNSDLLVSNPLFEPSENSISIVPEEASFPHDSLGKSSTDDDWSLDQIPGYQQYQEKSDQKIQSKRLLNLFSSSKPYPSKNRYQQFSYIGLFLIVIVSMGYYGLDYYSKQENLLNQEIEAFQIDTQVPNTSSKVGLQKGLQDTEEHKSEKIVVESEAVKGLKADKSEVVSKTESVKKKVESKVIHKRPPVQAQPNKVPLGKSVVKTQNKSIQITVKQAVRKDVLAYQAYQDGNYKLSKQLYQEAFLANKQNLYALFGLGAIAIQEHKFLTARRYYLRILKLEPTNAKAKQALLVIESAGKNTSQTKQAILQQLKVEPDNGPLRFSLGNLLAQEKDWVKAQEQYFKAYSLAPSNASYALNLAVSLDQLGQHRLAVKYYREAISLAGTKDSLVSKNRVQARIEVLVRSLQGVQNGTSR